MRIGIDARALEVNPAGIGRYIYEISKCLDEFLPDARFFYYSRRPIAVPKISSRWTHQTERLPYMRSLRNIPWHKLRSGYLCRSDRLDFYWASATFLPTLPSSVKTIVSVHDLNHLIVPETMPFLTRQAYRLFFESDLMKADVVMANSRGTAERLEATYGVVADLTVRPGVSPHFVAPGAEAVLKSLGVLNVRQPYILGLGTAEPRKNLSSLVDAFVALRNSGELPGYKLVLVGAAGWGNGPRLQRPGSHEAHDVVNLGYVEDRHLPSLYAASDVFVFPSLYEGFGIPALEATVCGARVVTTDIAELREATYDGAVYVRGDVNSIKDGILRALKSSRGAGVGKRDLSWRFQAKAFADLLTATYATAGVT